MADQNAIINDPNYVPVITHDGRCIVTHDDRIVIVSSTLNVRFVDATGDANRNWLTSPPDYHRGGGRP